MTVSAVLLHGQRRICPLFEASFKRLVIRPQIASKQIARYLHCIGSLDSTVLFRTGQQRNERTPRKKEQKIMAFSPLSHEDDYFLLLKFIKKLRHWLLRFYELLVVAGRSTEIALRLLPLTFLTPAAMIAKDLVQYDTPSNIAWWYTLHTLQQLGPAFVKLAQWIATRRDIFPPHICDRLAKLHDNGVPHSWSYTEGILKQVFGENYSQQVDVQSQDIIGCGSAAQVYRGLWKDHNGITKPVAVKVLHPDFRNLVERDLLFITSVANLVHSFPSDMIRMINLPRVADNFSQLLRRQADLRLEGDNLTQFRINFYGQADKRVGAVVFPKPLFSDVLILVEGLVQNAQPISNYLNDESKEGWKIRRELAGPLLRAFLKMVFLDNFVHCDLHPGNVLVSTTPAPNNTVKRSIVFLDAGIAVSLSPQDQQNLKDLFRAVLLNDGKNAGRLMVERAKFERCSQTPGGIDAFATGVQAIVSEFHDNRKQGLTLGAIRIGALLGRVLELCRVHGVEIDPAMASIVLSTLVLEGLGRSLEPDLNLIDFAIPFVLGRGTV